MVFDIICCFLYFNSSNLLAVQAVGVANTAVVPSPIITVANTATGSGMSQQPQRGGDDIVTTMGQGLFASRTEDSDDDYDA